MSGSRRSSRSTGGPEGAYGGSSRPTSGRPPASSFSTLGQYGNLAGQQYGSAGQEYDPRYGTEYQQYSSSQYDTQYSSQYSNGYEGGTGYDTAYAGSGYQTAGDYNSRAAYEDYTSGYGREELLRRAYGDSAYTDAQGQPMSSFNPYAELEQSRAAISASSGEKKLTRPTSAKRTSKPTGKGSSSSFNVFGKDGNKAARSTTSFHDDRQKSTTSRYDALKRSSRRGDDSDDQNIPSKAERDQSRRRMDDSYKHMMEIYAEQQKTLSKRPQWINSKTRGAMEPSDMTITHINQTRDLLDASILGAGSAETQTSDEWLNAHSIKNMKLSLKDLVDQGKIGKPGINRESGKVQQHIQFDAADLNEFEYKLNLAIETYTKRIKWLLMGSRKMFGVVKGSKVAVLVDTSDANSGFGRLTAFQEALGHLLDEQLSKKKGIYLCQFGTETYPLWPNVMDVNCRTIDETKRWIECLSPNGGCNVLRVLRHVFKVADIDQILLILGSAPDQNAEVLIDYIDQLNVGKDIPLQTVAYDCANHITNLTMRKLAENSGGRYHCYTSTNDEQIYTGTDIATLMKEIQTAQDVINKIKDMRQGMMGTALVSVLNEISTEVAKLPQSRFLPRPPGHEDPLRIEMPKFQASSSGEWLAKHGLKARSLDLYQVLAPNAYSYKEEFIPVIRKTVQSQVHEKAMAQFQWHDGSMKNVHVDMTQLFEYQKQLGAMVSVYEKRMDWLSSASRKIFGSVTEKNLVIIVDLSVSNVNYLVHIQHSLRLLLEQQMANKDYFNIIVFGSEAKAFRPTMSKPTPENLQKAWRWILELQCGGSRNYLDALHLAVENDEEAKHNVEVEGIYLFTSGIPDQQKEELCCYIEEKAAGRDLKNHVILFNVDDYDERGAIPSRYANITNTAECLRNIAHCSGGRFHWFRETGIIESDDISDINLEIEKALNFSKKCAMLVDSVKSKTESAKSTRQLALPSSKSKRAALPAPPCPVNTVVRALPAPKHSAIEESDDELDTIEPSKPKAIAWRPSSAKREPQPITALKPPVEISKRRPQSAKDPMNRVKTNKAQHQYFFCDNKKVIGSVYNKYPNKKPSRKAVKPIKAASIAEFEEQLTTKQWLRKYSLSKLKLDLNKLITGPETKFSSKNVKILHKTVESRVFSMFPTVNVGGTLKYLQLRSSELEEYEAQLQKVLDRYIRRLQWLLAGSNRVFGIVVERKCTILVDTSGSMVPYMEELKRELSSLIWDQIHRNRIMFNLIAFSQSCETWQDRLVEPTEDACHNAVEWVSQLQANGNTCTLDAIKLAFEDKDVEGIYLLTDGKPDNSTSMVLKEVSEMNTDRKIIINSISFNCHDSTANNFLKMLSSENNGRYHQCRSDFDSHKFAHKLLGETFTDLDHPENDLPDYDGDDLIKLVNEILQARRFLSQSKRYREVLEEHHRAQTDKGMDSTRSVTVGPGRIRPVSAKPNFIST